MPTLVRCFQYRLRPTPEQEQQFRQWAGCRRFIWNHFRERRQAHYLATGQSLSYAEMCKELTLLKQQEEYAFLNECASQALQQVLKDLCAAYTNFFAGRTRFPRRKSRKRTPHAFRIPQRVKAAGEDVSIPKLGKVPVVLHRPLEGEVKSATIKQEATGKWTISFVCHAEVPDPATGEPVSPLGLDAGLESFLTPSEGEKVAPPRFYRKQERKLKRAQRQYARKQKGSHNRNKARKRVAVVQARTRHQRADWLHKLSRRLCDNHDVICIEDLAVSALVKTKLRGHSKSWNDASWGTFRRQLQYKQEERGQRLVAISRWYPSSQECYACHQRTQHELSVRKWTCEHCAQEHDRDHNAAQNVLCEGLKQLVTGGNPDTLKVCGAPVSLPKRKQGALKQKPSGCEVRSHRL